MACTQHHDERGLNPSFMSCFTRHMNTSELSFLRHPVVILPHRLAIQVCLRLLILYIFSIKLSNPKHYRDLDPPTHPISLYHDIICFIGLQERGFRPRELAIVFFDCRPNHTTLVLYYLICSLVKSAHETSFLYNHVSSHRRHKIQNL